MHTTVLSWGVNGPGHEVVTHLHLVLRLRMITAIPLLPLYIFMAWTGQALPLFYIEINVTCLVTSHEKGSLGRNMHGWKGNTKMYLK
jgi:hypothetical protein